MSGALPFNGTDWSGWLLDSFVAFSVLLLTVLILRRPVARWFGPQVAYMLWALPALRWLMPPLALEGLGLTSITSILRPQAPESAVAIAPTTAISDAATMASTGAAPVQTTIDVTLLLPLLWIGGAVVLFAFLIRHHLKVMAQLKQNAGHLGEIDKVALYESHSTTSPLASGFWNRAIFLPQSIRHWPEETQRMAVAHEMTHHRAHHLIHNCIALALLCLNWFNPLAWAAARAFIVDQEADCDARTIAKYRFDRADYSTMLLEAAKVSRAPTWTLAPTAYLIPKKAIITRIRRISMNKNDTKMRFAGYGLAILGGLALLPLTASIAEADDKNVGGKNIDKYLSVSSNDNGPSTIRISEGGEPTYRRNMNYKGKSYALWSDRDVSDAEVLRQFEQSEKAAVEADKAMIVADKAMREAEVARGQAETTASQADEVARQAQADAAWAIAEGQNRGEQGRQAAEEARRAAHEARKDAEAARREAMQDARQAAEEARREAVEDGRRAAEEARREAIQDTRQAQVEARANAIAATNEARSAARAESIRARAIAQANGAQAAIASVDWNGVSASVNGATATARTIRVDRGTEGGRN